ncbi:hypothetical protein [Chitinophaga sp. Cy-1792]|uniref:hypothetical protein n=1 Tax=Chitinophaga sp. Cy-1792 TaxID=2608339 RepID=UPI0014222A76|nr:hypothetical protein [Chitinophaga sp. Cy-1792]NIG54107.1 hypothetical protein [Chitinophaga sp. Cy-1792]
MNIIKLLSHQAQPLGEKPSFSSFVWKGKTGRSYLLWAAILTVVQFVIFKMLYPFPDFISDSWSYIDTNLWHMQVNLWPIGYSWFLALVHLVSPSHVFLVLVQYLILQLALLYFFFTALYLLDLKRINANIFFIFLIVNPALLYLANTVLSDALFCSISLVIFAQYLWMYKQPKVSYILTQGILIGVAFMIRYTAMYYPLVAIFAILLTSYKLHLKLLGMILPWLIIIPFILHTEQETKKITGTAEFSVFGGWQIANNALYMRGHITVDSTKLPEGTQELDKLAQVFFSKVNPTEEQLADVPGTYFIKVPFAVLKPYLLNHVKITDHTPAGYFAAWGAVSPIYNKYGSYLIKHYPFSFMRYYMWLNTKNYFYPYMEKYTNYNLGSPKMESSPAKWFEVKDPTVYSVPPIPFQNAFFYLYKIFFTAINVYFLASVIFLLVGRKKNAGSILSFKAMLLAIVFLIVNFGFSVFATPVVLRYQFVPMIILLLFSLHSSELQPDEKSVKAAV